MPARFISLVFILSIFLQTIFSATAAATDGTPVFFRESGHTLAYNFRVFWDNNGGLPIFGYPLTEVFIENGQPVQYFERARLEWHGREGLVMAGLLGRWAASNSQKQPAFAPVSGPRVAGQDYFAETGHSLSFGFRDYWHSNGGLAVFGFPLSEEFQELNSTDGQTYTVQYFERARFEYHPDLPPRFQVELGQLGRQYLDSVKPAPPQALAPVTGPDKAWDGLRPTHIAIPRIKLDTDISEGNFSFSGWDVPRYTAVHYWPVASFPGAAGNITIAGHAGYKNSLFYTLEQATVGDEVVVKMGQAERRYHVTSTMVLLPTDSWVMGATESETLTLITCVPLNVFDHRLIVRAVPVE